MSTDILLQLGLSPEDSLSLSARLRDRLVYFLMRWQYYEALDACLNELLANRVLLSLLDLQAQMLLERGLLDKAWEAISLRHQRSASISSRILAARIRLARQEDQAALEIAQTLVKESPESSMAWAFLGEVYLAVGNEQAALAAYRRVNDLIPDSRSYLLGMIGVYQARGDWVTASAYAVRLQQTVTVESPLPISYLRRLRAYFEASKESNRVVDIDTELAARHAAELAELREALRLELAPSSGQWTEAQFTPHTESPKPIAQDVVQPLDSFETVQVSLQERDELEHAAQRLFGFQKLLAGQAEIMACTMHGEDVLAVLPTGGGKSLCYQLPALLAQSGTTLVISPLIALMKDQVDKLPAAVSQLATTINSSLEGDELERRLQGIRRGQYRLVYAAPERLRQPPFLQAVRQSGINRLVIDEVHCVSMWGHDFRPDYLYIAEARRALGNPPLLALTATAAPRVRWDILQRLGQMHIVAGDVMRSNLRLEVFHAHNRDEKLQYLLSFCRAEQGAGVVYARSRAHCEELAEVLRSQGVSAVHYHAGIENRAEVQDEFMNDRVRVIVATVAFGMGVDKPDIRFIIHFDPPSSLEAYYQEAGRAGRDGLPARCVLMYAPSDRAVLTRHVRQDALSEDFLRAVYAAIKKNLHGTSLNRIALDDLRRELQAEETPIRVAISILEQVGLLRRWPDIPRTVTLRVKSIVPGSDAELAAFCRVARLPVGQLVTRDLLDIAQQADLDARRLEERVLAWAAANLLEYRASARDCFLETLPPPEDAHGRMRALLDQYEKVQGQRVAEIVAYANTRRCRHGHISSYFGGRAIKECQSCDNCLSSPSQKASAMLPHERTRLWGSTVAEDDPLLQRLRAWRLEKARAAGVPAFMIAHDSLLRNIAAVRPCSEEELLAIKGMGPKKLERYGAELLALVSEADN